MNDTVSLAQVAATGAQGLDLYRLLFAKYLVLTFRITDADGSLPAGQSVEQVIADCHSERLPNAWLRGEGDDDR